MTTYYVDTDVSGGTGDGSSWANAYASLSLCEAGLPATQTDDVEIICRASAGTADTTSVTFNAGTSASYTFVIKAADGDEAVATGWDTSRYRLDFGVISFSTTSPPSLEGLQIKGSTAWSATVAYNYSSTATVSIKNCWVIGGTNVHGITINEGDLTATIENCIFESERYGVNLTAGTVSVSNCIVNGGQRGFSINSGVTAIIKNCAVFNTSDDFNDSASSTIDYCASDDGDGTNAISPSGSDWANEYPDYATGDFTPDDGGNVYHGGVAISGLTTDMAGETWNSPPTVGVLEIVAGGTTFNETVAESMVLTESSSGPVVMSSTVAESMVLTESSGGTLDILATVAESMSLSETNGPILSLVDTVGEAMTLSDGVSDIAVLSITVAESFVLSDTVSDGEQTYNETIIESFSIADTANIIQIINQAIAESITLSDSASGVVSLNLTINENLSLSDQLILTAIYNNAITEQLILTDAVSGGDVIDGKLYVSVTGKSGAITIGCKSASISVSYKS